MSPEATPTPELLTRNLCIDTSEYVAMRFAFSDGQLRRLAELAKAGKVRVFITPVIQREVESNIGEAAQDMMNAVQQMKKKAAMLRDVSLQMVRQFFGDYDRDVVIAHLHAQFADYLDQAQVKNIALAGADAEAVFELYFGKRAPFGQGKKKSEFPDAFIVASLDRWCREHAERMYVVTGDGGERQVKEPSGASHIGDEAAVQSMTSACTETGTLIPLPRLSAFLELVTRAEQEERVALARTSAVAEWASQHRALVVEYVADNFASLDFVPDDFEAEVEEISVLSVHVEEPDLVEIDDERAVLAFLAEVRYEASVHTIDPESGIWDSEDKVMLFQERYKITRRYSTVVEGEISVVVPHVEQDDPDAVTNAVSELTEVEDINILTSTVDIPIDDTLEDSYDPSQLDALA